MTTKTNINEFVKEVRRVLESNLEDYEVTEQNVLKMNDMVNHGILARRKGENSGATVYLDDAFESGENINSVAEAIITTVYNAETHKPLPADNNIDLSFDAIRDKLTLRLVDTEMNEEYLKEHPHRDIGAGLTVVSEINIDDEYSIVINNSMAVDYDLDKVFDAAEKNMRTRYPAKLINLESVVFGNSKNILDNKDEHIEGQYVLMIDEHNFGASTLAYKGTAERIRELFGSAYYILPSSLHEVIVIQDDGTEDIADLKAMVERANHTVVAPADVLSYSVFHYGADGLRRVA